VKPGFADARQQPAAFATPASGTFGNLGRNTFRAQTISAVDLALLKDLAVTERFRIDTSWFLESRVVWPPPRLRAPTLGQWPPVVSPAYLATPGANVGRPVRKAAAVVLHPLVLLR
jgi:hypothetical protein